MHPRLLALCALVVAALFAAGCGSSDSDSGSARSGTGGTTAGGSGVASEAVPPPAVGDVDRVTWALTYGEPPSLDWLRSADYSPSSVIANLCESLMRIEPDMTFAQGLARSVDHPRPDTWVYELRDDVRFWDGTPMTADDVVFSLTRAADPANGSPWTTAYQNVRGIKATGPSQVTVTLRRPDALFPKFMATPAGAVGSRAFVTRAGRTYGTPSGGVMCTGPFELGDWRQGSSITLRRNDAYWDEERRAHAGEVEFRFVSDEATLTSALRTGEIDGAYNVPPSSFAQLRQADGTLWIHPGLQSVTMTTIGSARPGNSLHDLRVRQALRLALDYEGISNGIFAGAASPMRSHLTPSTWGYSRPIFEAAYEALPPAETDMEAARRLVAEARPSKPIRLAAPSEAKDLMQVATAIQDAGTKAGLDVELKPMPTAEFVRIYFDEKARAEVDAAIVFGYLDFPEPVEQQIKLLTGSFYNFPGYANPEYDALVQRAWATDDDDARAELVVQAQEILVRDLPTLPIVARDVALFMNERITGAPGTFDYLYYPWAADVGAAR